MKSLRYFEKYKDIGVFALRCAFGIRLIYDTLDNLLSWEQMLEFSKFLESFNFPFPLVSAITSVVVQFLGGIMFILGYHIRLAAAIIMLNFTVALIFVHWGDTYLNLAPALHLWIVSFFLLTYGPGKIALSNKG